MAILKDIKVYYPFVSCLEGKNGLPEKDAEEVSVE